MIACKLALIEANGDEQAALELLRRDQSGRLEDGEDGSE